jgi:hypothetical protein
MKRIGILGPVVPLAAVLAMAVGLPSHAVQAQSPPFTGVCTTTTPSPFGTNVMTNCDSTVLPHFETTIAVDPTNPNHVVGGSIANEEPINGIVRPFGRPPTGAKFLDDYYTSFDGGATWIGGQVPGRFVSNADPSVAFDSRGRVFYGNVAYNLDSGGTPPGYVQVSRSDDGGVHFGTPAIVYRFSGTAASGADQPYIAVDSSPASPHRDDVYMTWEQVRLDKSGAFLEAPVLLSVSHDAGQTWSPAKEISGSNPALCAFSNTPLPADGRCRENQDPQPAVAPDGTIYVAFENQQADNSAGGDPTRYQDLVVKSTDGGDTWSTPVRASDLVRYGNTDVQPFPNPLSNSAFETDLTGHLAVDPNRSGTIYIVWFDNRNGTPANTNTDVFLAKSTDAGATWSPPQVVSAAAGDQWHPWVAVAPDGTVDVMFQDRSYDAANSKYGITLARLQPGSSQFALQRVDTGLSDPNHSLWFSDPPGGQASFIGDYNGMAIGSDGVTHLLWTDMRRIITVKKFTGTTEDIMTAAVP